MPNTRIEQGEKARDFTLIDTFGKTTRLSDFKGAQNVFLVFNRGFT
jgi:peroxiredoxin